MKKVSWLVVLGIMIGSIIIQVVFTYWLYKNPGEGLWAFVKRSKWEIA